MAHSARQRRILFLVLGALMLFCVTASGADAQDRTASSTSRDGGIVKIPVVDKQDIRFTHVSGDKESFQRANTRRDRAG